MIINILHYIILQWLTIKKDFLFVLIKSLSKSEKRQFKIFASRLETSSNTKFIELFNILDKSDLYDEKIILKSGVIKKCSYLI
jgi:hypothetical protein